MKRTVFISSTFQDLSEHRRAIWEMLKKFDVDVRGMEQFGARTEGPLETCFAEVEQSDVYVGIVGFRLGSVDKSSGKSFTQLEYEHALNLGKTILIYLMDEEKALVPFNQIDIDPSIQERLRSFKRTLRERHTVDTFTTSTDIVTKLERDFRKYLSLKEENKALSNTDEYKVSRQTIDKFMLTPKLLSGSEILLKVKLSKRRFPVARSLCQAFNLPYGSTVGISISIIEPPTELTENINELYCSGNLIENLLTLPINDPIDIYARLEFSPKDVFYTRARFFGYCSFSVPAKEMEPNGTNYEPGEGKIILTFSKLPKSNNSIGN